MEWRIKKQLTVLAIAAALFAVLIFVFITFLLPSPTCFDNKKNQGETGVDCGGPCEPCSLKNPQPITIFWARFSKVQEGAFDAVADIKNPNEFLGSPEVIYRFQLLDSLGAVIAEREGKTFLLPKDELHIIENNLLTSRKPHRVKFDILNSQWKFGRTPRPDIIVDKRDIKKIEENGLVKTLILASILNRAPKEFKKVEVAVVLLDESQNLLGGVRIILRDVKASDRRAFEITWPADISEQIKVIEIEPRADIFEE